MKSVIKLNSTTVANLVKFLDQNQKTDFLCYDLRDEEKIEALNFKSLTKKKQELIPLIKAYQRLIRIIPDEERETALILLKNGIHSALQIASMTRNQFMKKYGSSLGSDGKLAGAIYNNALEKRSALLIQYMNILQNREPHISGARFS